MLAAGVDGCPGGWICITRDTAIGRIDSHCYPDAVAMFAQQPRPNPLCVDIPIGLLAAGARLCDVQARESLGPRKSSVFSAPLRPMLEARSWEEACEIRSRIEGKRIPKQVWGIIPKVREVDELLRKEIGLVRALVREVHPELSFSAWAGAPMEHRKKSSAGRAERRALVDSHFGVDAYPRVRARHPRGEVASDDILDAFAALWTAERVNRGDSMALPAVTAVDSCGLPMEMVF